MFDKLLEKLADFFFSEPCIHKWYGFRCVKCDATRDYNIFDGWSEK